MARRVSLKDIASECKVSVATVSKALNDQDDIGEATKNYVRKVAEKMGYFPNFAAQALKTNRTYNIGVLFVDDSQSGLTHDYFSRVLDSFQKTVEESGYDLTFISGGVMANRNMTYLEHARYRNFDGVVIACVDFNEKRQTKSNMMRTESRSRRQKARSRMNYTRTA